MQIAVAKNHRPLVEYFLEHGEDLHGEISENEWSEPMSLLEYALLSVVDLQLFTELLRQGANPNIVMTNGMSPLEYTLLNYDIRDKFMFALLRHGADANGTIQHLEGDLTTENDLGTSFLQYAVKHYDEPAVRYLVEGGAHIGIPELKQAAFGHNDEMFLDLLLKGAPRDQAVIQQFQDQPHYQALLRQYNQQMEHIARTLIEREHGHLPPGLAGQIAQYLFGRKAVRTVEKKKVVKKSTMKKSTMKTKVVKKSTMKTKKSTMKTKVVKKSTTKTKKKSKKSVKQR